MSTAPVAIVQARMGSSRLPGKVLAPVGERRLLDYVIRRCQSSRRLGGVVLATTTLPGDDRVAEAARDLGVGVFRGDESDVLGRYLGAAEQARAEVIVRITADCPLIDPAIIDQAVEAYAEEPADYVYVSGYPNGLGAAEVLRVSALMRANCETTIEDTYYREHVMTYLTDHPEKFSLNIRRAPVALHRPEIRLSVDEAADLALVRCICEHFHPRIDFGAAEIIAFLDQNPDVARLNADVKQKTR